MKVGKFEFESCFFLTYVYVQWLFVSNIYKQEYADREFLIIPHVAKIKTNK
jgi:hypothetical protein